MATASTSIDAEEPTKESLESIRETEKLIASGDEGYESPEEMFETLGI